jgi:hypothetical protein
LGYVSNIFSIIQWKNTAIPAPDGSKIPVQAREHELHRGDYFSEEMEPIIGGASEKVCQKIQTCSSYTVSSEQPVPSRCID